LNVFQITTSFFLVFAPLPPSTGDNRAAGD